MVLYTGPRTRNNGVATKINIITDETFSIYVVNVLVIEFVFAESVFPRLYD